MQRAGGHIFCGLLKILDVVCGGMEDIFIVKIVRTCIHMLTGTRNKNVLRHLDNWVTYDVTEHVTSQSTASFPAVTPKTSGIWNK